MTIIDEAQHVAGFAFSSDSAARAKFAAFQSLCESSERLLLLSATPVLNNERDFLAMLNLLDPQVYGLDDLESFRDRVRRRQDVGHILLSLQEGTPGFLLQETTRQLREYFPEDEYLGQLAAELDGAIDRCPGGGDDCDRAVRAIRVHISETYRLHRRMLRNRRGSVRIESMLGRAAGERDTPRTLEYDIDERSARLHELLEEWRKSALGSLGWDENENESSIDPFSKIFRLLLAAAGTWFGLLEDVIAVRLGENPKSGLSEDLATRRTRGPSLH